MRARDDEIRDIDAAAIRLYRHGGERTDADTVEGGSGHWRSRVLLESVATNKNIEPSVYTLQTDLCGLASYTHVGQQAIDQHPSVDQLQLSDLPPYHATLHANGQTRGLKWGRVSSRGEAW